MNTKLYPSKLKRSESFQENSPSSDKFWKPFVFLPTSRSWLRNQDKNRGNKETWNLQLSRDIIGENETFNGPFGLRKAIYFDYTASGRSIRSIERFIREQILPVYGNTHTTTSFFASEITACRNEAREIIHSSCGGGINDEVIFCGSGATGAVHKLIHAIHKSGDPPPFVITGPFEHHSNFLPWREIAKKTVMIPEDSYGRLDMDFLKQTLTKLSSKRSMVSKKRQIIGVFSASSNVTGALTDDVAVTALMHSYGGFAFWDYAAAAPHVKINMNPSTHSKELDVLAQKDAIIFSGHKFLGGPQTPGVLIAKRHVFRNPFPHGAGGGTVLFVTQRHHQYLKAIHEREEGGTPSIVESIRLGLVFQLKNQISDEVIINTEAHYARLVLDAWKNLPELVILGHKENPRIPIVSFLVKHLQSGYFLHHDFVVALLNDLFGIQCRGGCMCAGPYAQVLLGINDSLSTAYEDILSIPKNSPQQFLEEPQYDVIFKPGFIRVSLPYHASIDEVNYLIDAVKFVAVHGWKLLPIYRCSFEDGSFRCRSLGTFKKKKPQRKLESFRFSFNLEQDETTDDSRLSSPPSKVQPPKCLNAKESLEFANTSLIGNMHKILMREPLEDDTKHVLPQRKHLRWFLLPSEALEYFKNFQPQSPTLETLPISPIPFHPKETYKTIDSKVSEGNLQKKFTPGSIPYTICSTNKWDSRTINNIDPSNFETQGEKLRELTKQFENSLIASRKPQKTAISLQFDEKDENSDEVEDDLLFAESPPLSNPSSGFHEVNFRGSSYF